MGEGVAKPKGHGEGDHVCGLQGGQQSVGSEAGGNGGGSQYKVLFGNEGISRVDRVTDDEFGGFGFPGRFPFDATEERGEAGVRVKDFLANDRRGDLLGALKRNGHGEIICTEGINM